MTRLRSQSLPGGGACLCGCGQTAPRGAYFCQGHDKAAESMLIRILHGSVAGFLADHGYGPGGMNLRAASLAYEKSVREGGLSAPVLKPNQARAWANEPHVYTLRVAVEDAPNLALPHPWYHAAAMDRGGVATFVHPGRAQLLKAAAEL